MTIPDESRDQIGKFEIGWCIPHRMAADNAEGRGGSGQIPPPPHLIGLKELFRNQLNPK